MSYFFIVTEYLLFAIIGLQSWYFLIFALAGLLPRKLKSKPDADPVYFAVLIPAYKEDKVIIDTARAALSIDYPRDKYRTIILADQCKPETIAQLNDIGVEVLEVFFENSTKAKSVNKGLELLNENPPEAIVILDSDNHMATDFLKKASATFRAGYPIIQGHRTAKNKNTPFALLDAANEEIGNHIFRKGHRVLGLSSALIGSAMVFDFELYKKYMADILDVAGEDKLLELNLLRDGQVIEYLQGAYVYDEKVSNSQTFGKQRTRWIGAQLYFLKNYFFDGLRLLVTRGNIDYFDKCFQMALVPKVMMIALLGFLGVVSWFWSALLPWWQLMLVHYAAMLISVPKSLYNRDLVTAIFNIPKAVFTLIFSILRINKKTASTFEVTEKGQDK